MVLNILSMILLIVTGFHGEQRTAQFTAGDFFYSNWDAPHMTIDSCVARTAEHIIVPDSVVHNCRKYGIVEVGANAFRGMHNLTDITFMMDNEVGLCKGAFKECPRLRVIRFTSPTPGGVGKHPFYGGTLTEIFEPYHLENTFIVVPPGAVEAYRQAEGWCRFKYIQDTWPSNEEINYDEIDIRINELESKLLRARQAVDELQREIEALRYSREMPLPEDTGF